LAYNLIDLRSNGTFYDDRAVVHVCKKIKNKNKNINKSETAWRSMGQQACLIRKKTIGRLDVIFFTSFNRSFNFFRIDLKLGRTS
jgi:hypothetical protein